MYDEGRHAGVLANRAFVVFSHIHVGNNDVERLRGLCPRGFALGRDGHGGAHVGRQIGRGLRDQLQQTVGKKFHNETCTSILRQRSAEAKAASPFEQC
jgi:hypothetical protein